jgi:uncharacterized membrane protein
MTKLRWQDGATLAAGIWLLISPWAVGYAGDSAAMGNAVIFGIAIIIYSGVELSVPRPWEEWLMMAAGVWLIIAPWVLVFGAETRAVWDSVIVGIVVLLLALWAHSTMTSVADRTSTIGQ